MVVMWCRECGALLGVREPVTDWSSDETVVCPECRALMTSFQEPGSGQVKTEGEQATEPRVEDS
jgi:hypothetical protein